MIEGPPDIPDETPESIPSEEDVRQLFEKLLEGAKYQTIRQREDANGLYYWEIRVPGEKGYYKDYIYMRAGRYEEEDPSVPGVLPRLQSGDTDITVTLFDENDMPYGGHSVAKYIDGKWKLTP